MFFYEFILFIGTIALSLISISGFGALLVNSKKANSLELIFFGFPLIALIVTFFHFFFNINIQIIFIIFLAGVIIFFLKKLNKKFLIFENKKLYFILLILIPIYISQKYHEDFGYYHLPHIINFYNEKIIFGLANTNVAFIHNSLWLNILNLFYIGNINFITIPTYILYVVFVIFSLNELLNDNKKNYSIFFLLICTLYILLKFTRISEFGNDLPALVFAVLSIYNFFKFNETTNEQKKIFIFFCSFCFSIFAILIKFSCIPLLFLPVYLFFKNYRFLCSEILKLNYFLIYFLSLTFFFQQFIYSGCFIFPSDLTCIEVSWFDSEFVKLKDKIELTNKSFYVENHNYSKEDYLKNFTWVPFWFERNYSEILEHLSTIIIPIIIILLLSKKNREKQLYKLENFNFFSFFVVCGFLFWFTFSPVYRFGIIYFLSLVFLLTLKFYKNRFFSSKIIFSIICVCLIFNFSKNILRIIENDKVFFGLKKIENSFINISNSKNNFISINKPDIEKNIKNGWQGRLCWDIEFLCSYNEINVNKKYGYLIISKLKN